MMLDIVSIKMLLIFVISYIILLFVIAISSNNDQCWHVAFTFKYSHGYLKMKCVISVPLMSPNGTAKTITK